jgi:proteasome lid subunit RPN8/RPN11
MQIILTQNAKRKIETYTRLAEGEISGLMRVDRVSSYSILVKDIIIFDQKSSGSETELDSEALSKFLTEEIQAGRDVSDIKGWWHSHADMGVFWSATDTENMRTLGCEWFLSIVSNKKKETKARLDVYNPFRLIADDLDVEEEPRELTEKEKQIQTLLEELEEEEERKNKVFEEILVSEIAEKVEKPKEEEGSSRGWFNNYRGRPIDGYHRNKSGVLVPNNPIDLDYEEDDDEFLERQYNNYYDQEEFLDDEKTKSKKKYRRIVCEDSQCDFEKIIKRKKPFSNMKCDKCHAFMVDEDEYVNARVVDLNFPSEEENE